MSHFGNLRLVLTLSYTITPSGNDQDYQITDGLIEFRCNYSRTIDVDDFKINVNSRTQNPIQKIGNLKYNVEVIPGDKGQLNTMIFTTEHNLTGVVAT